MKKLKSIKGFTLIELLTVISLLGALAAVVLVAIDPNAQLARARDTQRKSDIKQLQSALEIYRADNGSYPTSVKNCPIASPANLGNSAASTPCTITYLTKVPADPKGSTYWNSGNYLYSTTGSSYNISACLENATDKDASNTATSPGGSGTCSSGIYYQVFNP